MGRILIVDDSPSQLMGMKRIVEKLGHEAVTAEDGAAFEWRLGDQSLPLVVLQQRGQRVPDHDLGGLVAGVEQEDAVVQQLGLGQRAFGVALQQAREHVGLWVARVAAALRKASVFLGCRLMDNNAAEIARIEVRDAVRAALSE